MSQPKELPELRDRFGGCASNRANDRRAINKHSTRTYEYEGVKYQLDRNLSTHPPFYQLLLVPEGASEYNGKIMPVIKVDGEDRWGDGLRWKQAEAIAYPAIIAYAKQGASHAQN